MLKLSDLALRPDSQLGPLLVSPSRRLFEGPGGYVHLEPLIMQVFLLLLDARGKVVTRNQLFDECWGGVIVGDDSLNRAIAKVRRAGGQVAPGLYEIETIPRTGYRLTGAILDVLDANTGGGPGMSRRVAFAAAASAATLAGAGGLWWLTRPAADPRVDSLIARAEQAMRNGNQIDEGGDARYLEEAVRVRPDNATAWGLLAFVRASAADDANPDQSTAIIQAAEVAAARARALQPNEPHALLALAFIRSRMGGWLEYDRALRHILSIDPRNTYAMAILVALTQAAGLTRESWALNERALELEPLDSTHIFRKALKLWIMGRVEDSYRVIDRAFDLWPENVGVWNARLVILAFTERTEAASAMLDDGPANLGSPAAAAMWRTVLPALAQRSESNLEEARSACLDAAGKAPGLAAHSVMILSGIGDVDAALEVANGFLLSRGRIVMRAQLGSRTTWVSDPGWKWTQWLFTPPVAPMRADRRFLELCNGIGLVDYWRSRGIRPDYQLA